MAYTDKTLECVDCGASFTLSGRNQAHKSSTIRYFVNVAAPVPALPLEHCFSRIFDGT